VFASSSARNLVRRPQKRTKCYKKHSEKQRWVGPRHLGHWESEASPVKCQDNADRFLWRGGSGASRVSSPTPDHESDCLYNRSATPSRYSLSETASQMVFRLIAQGWLFLTATRIRRQVAIASTFVGSLLFFLKSVVWFLTSVDRWVWDIRDLNKICASKVRCRWLCTSLLYIYIYIYIYTS
jgi:hypothetical protein